MKAKQVFSCFFLLFVPVFSPLDFGHEGLPNGCLHVLHPSAKENSFSFNFVKILHENFPLGIICFTIRKLAIGGLLLGIFALIADIWRMNPPGNLQDYEVRLQELSEKINSVMKEIADNSENITTREHQADLISQKDNSELITIRGHKHHIKAKIRTLEDSCNGLILLSKSKKEELNQLIENNNKNTKSTFNYQEETVKINGKLKETQQERGLLEEELYKAEEMLKLATYEQDVFKQKTENMKEKLKQIESSFQKQITTLRAATDANRRKDFKMNWHLEQKIRELHDLKRRLDIEQEMRRREEFRRQMAQRPRMKTSPKTKTVRFLEAGGSGTSNQPKDTKKQKDISIATTPQTQHEPVARPDSMENRNSINVDTATSVLPSHGNFQGPILTPPPQSSAKIRTLENSCNGLILLNKSKKEELNQLIENNSMNTMSTFNYQEETLKINAKLKEMQQESGLLEEELNKAEEILKLATYERDVFKQKTENMKERLKQIESSFQKQITSLRAATDANRIKDFKMNWHLAQKIRELHDLKRRLDIEQEMRRPEEFRRQMAQRPRMKTSPKTKTVCFLEAGGSGTSNQPKDTKNEKDISIATTPQTQHEPVARQDSTENRNSINVVAATLALPSHGNFQGPILTPLPQSSDLSIEKSVTPCLSSAPDPAVPIAGTIKSSMKKDNELEEDKDEDTDSRASSPWTGPFSSGYVGQHFTRAMCFVNDESKINRRPLQDNESTSVSDNAVSTFSNDDLSMEKSVTPCLSSAPDPAVPIANTINSSMKKDNEHEDDNDEDTDSRASSPWTGPFSSGYVGQHFTRAMCFVNDGSKMNRRPLQDNEPTSVSDDAVSTCSNDGLAGEDVEYKYTLLEIQMQV